MENIFQSAEWERFKLEAGYQKSYRIEDILVLQKNLPLGRTMLYSPMVNLFQADPIAKDKVKMTNFFQKIKEIGQENNSIFYRLELDIKEKSSFPFIENSPFKKAFEEMQPEHTLILDISKTEADILAQMKQKGRYNVHLAERNGIEIKKTNAPGKELDDFFEMYTRTGKRHSITFRSKNYFSRLLEILGKSDYAWLYIAYHGKKAIAGAIIVDSGDTAIYMFGASSDEYKNLMAPYLLHWQALSDAKAAGKKQYDFFGIAPDDNPRHPWSGVTRFKKNFGGNTANILGSYDLILRPFEYQIFKIAEKIRR